jgi:hypothetical protein
MTFLDRIKYAAFSAALESEPHVGVVVATAEAVIPEHLMREKTVVLAIGRRMAKPIHDLAVDARGISATLSFNLTLFECFIPWRAVQAFGPDQSRECIWFFTAPEQLVAMQPPRRPTSGGSLRDRLQASLREPPRPALRLVKSDDVA